MWYHGGDLKNGTSFGTYLYVTENRELAEHCAREHPPDGSVYRLRPGYHELVTEHHDGSGRPVIRQSDLRSCGGALAVFEATGELDLRKPADAKALEKVLEAMEV
jgi:hypothetical protein